MKYPTNLREMLIQNDCHYAYIMLSSGEYSKHKVYIFEPLDVNYNIETAEAIAIPYIKRLCELHPEWNNPATHLYASVSVGNACTGELRDIFLPTIWHEITGKW